MKKTLTIILSTLMALLMCFTFVACGGNNDPDNKDNDKDKDKPAVTVLDKAAASIKNLYTANGYKLGLDMSYGTASMPEDLTLSIAGEKRGDRIKLTAYGEDVLIDLATGFVYYPTEIEDDYGEIIASGTAYDAELPVNVIDYAGVVVKAMLGDEKIEIPEFGYKFDKTTNTLSYDIDLAAEVNGWLKPIYEAYKKDDYTLTNLVNTYIAKLTDGAYRSIGDVFGYVATLKDNTCFDLITLINLKFGVNVLEIIEQQRGEPIPAEVTAALKTRKVKEMLVALAAYMTEIMKDAPQDGSFEFDQTVMAGALRAALYAPVDAATVDKEFETALEMMNKSLTAKLDEMKIKDLVDGMVADYQPEIAEMIMYEVTFKTLKASVSLKLDEKDRFAELKANFDVSHTYVADTEVKTEGEGGDGDYGMEPAYKLLADNDYKGSFKLSVTEYADNAGTFELPEVIGGDAFVTVFVYGEVKDDIKVYMETEKKELVVGKIDSNVASIFDLSKMTPLEVKEGDITVDGATKTVTVKASFVNAALEELKDDKYGANIFVYLYENAEDLEISSGMYLVYLPTDSDSISEFLNKLVLMAQKRPVMPEPDIPEESQELAYAA